MRWVYVFALCTRNAQNGLDHCREMQHKRLNCNHSFSSTSTQLVRQCHLQEIWNENARQNETRLFWGKKYWSWATERVEKRQYVWVGKGQWIELMAAALSLRDIGPHRFSKLNIQCNYSTLGHNSNNGESETINFDKRIKILFIRETGRSHVMYAHEILKRCWLCFLLFEIKISKFLKIEWLYVGRKWMLKFHIVFYLSTQQNKTNDSHSTLPYHLRTRCSNAWWFLFSSDFICLKYTQVLNISRKLSREKRYPP